MYSADGHVEKAETVFETFVDVGVPNAVPHVRNTLIDALIDAGEDRKARSLFDDHRPRDVAGQDAIDAAILARRARESRLAHRYFVNAGDAVQADPRALLEFAQTKIWLAHQTPQPSPSRRLWAEARTLLERVVQMDTSSTRHAWAWRELGRTREALGDAFRDIEDAYSRAIELRPDEPRFRRELADIRARLQTR